MLLTALAACSDDLRIPGNSGIYPDGELEISFSIPSPSVVATRADEDPESLVRDLSVLVFSGDDESSSLIQSIDGLAPESLGDDRYKVSFKLDDDVRKENSPVFYFIANPPGEFSAEKGNTLADIKNGTLTSVSHDGTLVMSGKSSLENLFDSDVPLVRNAAKVTVSAANDSGNTTGAYDPEEPVYPFAIFGDASQSGTFAGTLDACASPEEISGYPASIDEYAPSFIHPTLNADLPHRGKCFIVAKIPFNDVDFYYRLDFKISESIDGEETERYLDVKPNHWYQVMILNVNGAGYPSPEEAAVHPSPLIDYTIHDHSPEIYNMISDGIRELGVTHQVTYTNGANADNEWSGEWIYIKCFSIYDDEMPDAGFIKGCVSSDCDWLTLGEPEIVTDTEITGSDNEEDPDSRGMIFRCPLRFDSTEQTGSLYTTVKVSWKGLTREIPVIWERLFNGNDLCEVTLKMIDGSNNVKYTVNDYWGFLESEGTPSDNDKYPALWGILPENNNGKERNRGFHFPVMYGETGLTEEARWSYSYDINMTALKDYDFDWNITVKGDPAVTNVEISGYTFGQTCRHTAGSDLKFTLTRPGNACSGKDGSDGSSENDYTYGTGSLVLSLIPVGNTRENQSRLAQEYIFGLYHTGFFHKDEQRHRVDTPDPDSFYYYEVVPIMGAYRMRYWLDRNLGAKSAEMYIEATGGMTYHGNPDAAGGYYTVAKYKGDYSDPALYSDVAPPGYRVPMQKVWDALKNSKSFVTDISGSYFSAYYDTGNPSIGKVFFPKAMMMNDGNKLGESRAGYYWTQTAASGTEKEEIGKWLKMLMISGTSASYINGDVTTYGGSVRCINDINDATELQRTSFNVSGATHIFLYSEQNGVKVPTTTWPGHAIGDYNTMTDKWFNFAFESAEFAPQDLYVIFNFIDADGIIHTICKETAAESVKTNEINPANATGWKVIGDTSQELFDSDISGFKDGNPTALGYWWKCSLDPVGVYCAVKDYGPEMTDSHNYRIYWDKNLGFPYIRVNNIDCGNTGEYNGFYYLDLDVSEAISFHLYNGSDKYQANGQIDWKVNSNDFININGVNYYTVIRYDLSYGGIPGSWE